MGEATGMVYFKSDKGTKGLGRIIVSFFNSDSVLVGKTLTEADGSFSFLGLSPGSYTAHIDAAQLRNLQLASSPNTTTYYIKQQR